MPSVAVAAPGALEGERVDLEVRVDLVDDDAEARASETIHAELAARLAAAGAVVEPGAEIQVKLQLRETEEASGETGFAATGTVQREGVRPSGASAITSECTRCNASEFIAELGVVVVEKLPALAAPTEQHQPAPRPAVVAAPPRPPARRKYLPTSKIGAVSLWMTPVFAAYGAAGLGIYLGTRDVHGNNGRLDVLGATMGLVGAGVVAVTLPMLAVDIHRYRKRRRVTASAGSFGSRSAALVLRGRF